MEQIKPDWGEDDFCLRAWAKIDLTALAHNLAFFQTILGKTKVMAVVKANGYGHGASEMAGALNKLGVDFFAVATLDEAIELRRNGIKEDILILGYTDPRRAKELSLFHLIQTVVDKRHGQLLSESSHPVRVHIKVDTGMHRLGIAWEDTKAMEELYHKRNLRVEGIFSHLSSADLQETRYQDVTRQQESRFDLLLLELKKKGISPGVTHLYNTAGAYHGKASKYDYARIGIGLYGVKSTTADYVRPQMDLQPVLSLYSKIVHMTYLGEGDCAGYGQAYQTQNGWRRIGVVSIGYADGVPRSLSEGNGLVIVAGTLCPIVGRICMDQMLIDVTQVPSAQVGDTVTLIGTEGGTVLSAEDMSRRCATITNELLSRLGTRIERVYAAYGKRKLCSKDIKKYGLQKI